MSLKILDRTLVSPPPPPAGEVRPPLPLTFFDVLWLKYKPVERLFFYNFPHSAPHFLHSHLPILKSSLSAALSTFYPLAATIRRRPSDNRFEIATSESDAVSLTVSEHLGDAADFLDISGDHSRRVNKLLPLVPRLEISQGAIPLLAIQITLFPKQGLCLALAVHHAACDGFSSMQFVKLWSATAAAGFRAEELVPKPPAPFMDRAAIPDPRKLYAQIEKAVLDERAEELMLDSGISAEVFAATFTLSAAGIGRLKEEVGRKAAEQGISCPRCSAFVVSFAYSWICWVKTRGVADGEGKAHSIFAVDWRRRNRPAFPANYFGNCIGGCFARCDAGELLSKDGILIGCAALGRGIEELGDEADGNLDGVVEKIGAVAQWRPVTVAGSPGMGVYETDFGWGKARKVEVVSTRETGAIAMAESRDGEGGIEIGVILPEEDLKAFARHFAGGLDW